MTSNTPQTLRVISGMSEEPAALSQSTLIMIDCQNTYREGVMELAGVEAALDEARILLERARKLGIPIIHIQHNAGSGSPYDLESDLGQIADKVSPQGDESVITKTHPNAFVNTQLHEQLQASGAQNLVLTGFMTHMCVNSTARGAFNLGYAPTVVAAATATRALLDGEETIPADMMQKSSLAAVADLFGVVVRRGRDLPD
ncbi:MAG: cysteine hydrolase family protein [Gammaproteobacteria bacterium]|nr:cysteine hydrolase [Gammaproteobacteria bacterium]